MKSIIKKISVFCIVLATCSCTEVIRTHELHVDSLPTQTVYEFGEKFSSQGLVIKNENNEVVKDYLLSKHEGDILSYTGKMNVVVNSKNYKSTSFSITVGEKENKQLKITHEPNNTFYQINDKFASDGLVVTCNGETVTDFATSIVNGETLATPGMLRVKVTKEGYSSTHFNIYVNEDSPKTSQMLSVFYMNDTHGAFVRKNTDAHYTEAGMSYISSYLNVSRLLSDIVLLSGGDMFQGGFESNQTSGKIMAEAMNIMQFDAMVLGNHEFDWGEVALKNIADTLNFPILSCNTFYKDSNEERPEYIDPYFVLNKNGIKIGVIGAALEDMSSSITGSIANDFEFPDPVPYIKRYSQELRTVYNCDLIFCGFHDAGFDGSTFKYSSLATTDPSTNMNYVDSFFFAHDHRYVNGKYNGIPYVESACNARKLGNITLTLDSSYKVTYASASNISAYYTCLISDSNVEDLLDKYQMEIGTDELICILNKSYTRNEFASLIAKSMLWYVNSNKKYFGDTFVYLASHNYGGVRAEVEKGPLFYSDLVNLTPFDNALCLQVCSKENINYALNSNYLATMTQPPIIYTGNYTNAVTISYVAEHPGYSRYTQVSATKFNFITAKQTIYNYLKMGLELA